MVVHFCTVFHVSGYTGHDFLKCFACRMNIHSRIYIYIYTFLFSIALKTFYRVCVYKEKRKHEREREREREKGNNCILNSRSIRLFSRYIIK